MSWIWAVVLTACMLCSPVWSADDDGIRIAPYRDGKDAAISLTFDDGWKQQVENTLAVLQPLGIRGTFFFMPLAMEQNPGSHASWQRARELQEAGHEIGTHAKVKPHLHEVDPETLDRIVNGGHDLIAEKTGVHPVSFARPGGTKVTPAVEKVVRERHAFIRKPNKLGAKVVAYGQTDWRPWREERERAKIEETIAEGGWRIAVIHGIHSGYSSFPERDGFRNICEFIVSQEERLWIAPMGEVGRYVTARDACTLTIAARDARGCTVSLACPDPDAERFAKTLTVIIPAQGDNATAQGADGSQLPVQRRDGEFLVDVPTGGGLVRVSW